MELVFLVCIVVSYVYEDGDSLIVDNDSLTLCGQHQYNVLVDIRNNGILYVRTWSPAADSFGTLGIYAPRIMIRGGSLIYGSTRGPAGAYLNMHPWGYGTGGGGAGGVSGGAGGGAAYGGNGGMGGDLYGGSGGIMYGSFSDTLIEPGSGGGAGRLSAVDGIGGNGGAVIFIHGTTVLCDSSRIEVSGQRGYDGSLEAGGGGSGGGIMIRADSITLYHSEFYADGNNGGDAGFGGGGGGAGGRIKIFYIEYLDTTSIVLSASGGSAGSGPYGNPQPGEYGTVYFDQIVGLDSFCDAAVTPIHVFPNPAATTLTMTSIHPACAYEIYNISGTMVMRVRAARRSSVIDICHLPAGVYMLKSAGEHAYSVKFIVVR
jgi:hypothetical protein